LAFIWLESPTGSGKCAIQKDLISPVKLFIKIMTPRFKTIKSDYRNCYVKGWGPGSTN
jgi:hypothetical protein